MEHTSTTLPYKNTGYFAKIVIDYIEGNKQLQGFYNYPVSSEGIKASIKARQAFATDRKLLVSELKKQYTGISLSSRQEQNLELLLSNDTFTITTAHQPNIFAGPLYFIYKILHTVKLADELAEQFPQHKFVPVYYMGSEDADLDELGHIQLNGERITWNAKQTGAVGRMKVDKAFISLIDTIHGQIGIHEHGKQLTDLFRKCYKEGTTIQQATLELVTHLFGDWGVLTLIPDNAEFKKTFAAVVQKELTEQFSHKAVAQTINELDQHYKVQAGGREINLFYLLDNKRERVEMTGEKFRVMALQLEWTKKEILTELNEHPERFSANVILRGVFQEMILPNIAFIGGGGELAYWFELKKLFEAAGVPYPVLVLRNSFLLVKKYQTERMEQFGFSIPDFFLTEPQLVKDFVERASPNQIHLDDEMAQANELYLQLKNVAGNIDPSLQQHTEALHAKTMKQLNELEKKMLRAEKRKFETELKQLIKLKQELFPGSSLQERVENFSSFYARYGKEWLQTIYKSSKGLAQEFTVISTT